jgi:hypothetical protein
MIKLVACIPMGVKSKAFKGVDFPAYFHYGYKNKSLLGEFGRTEIRKAETLGT